MRSPLISKEIISPLFFVIFYIIEFIYPKYKFRNPYRNHIFNIAIGGFNYVIVTIFMIFCFQKAFGSFLVHNFKLNIIVSYLLYDLMIYFQHRIFHKSDFLWKFHKLHHTDKTLNSTSGFRFHPVEILISMFVKLSFVVLFNLSAYEFAIFELIILCSSVFIHANINSPMFIDKFLSNFIVTPRVHWVHHRPNRIETNSNFGFFISIWDKIFKTYIEKSGFENSSEFGVKED